MSTGNTIDYVGKRIVDEEEHVDNVDSDVIHKDSLPEGTRVLKPDSMATLDYREDRLNLHVDETGTVIKQNMG